MKGKALQLHESRRPAGLRLKTFPLSLPEVLFLQIFFLRLKNPATLRPAKVYIQDTESRLWKGPKGHACLRNCNHTEAWLTTTPKVPSRPATLNSPHSLSSYHVKNTFSYWTCSIKQKDCLLIPRCRQGNAGSKSLNHLPHSNAVKKWQAAIKSLAGNSRVSARPNTMCSAPGSGRFVVIVVILLDFLSFFFGGGALSVLYTYLCCIYWLHTVGKVLWLFQKG